ncbi:hypothetical protein EST38_g1328 [Candolleomyces aberdarensis]|uniref:Protein kinase domain-containing protein n=1 Tax=Candolleomyces aberdarensis TaxID=2316362 RepID=A0A4Q2DYT4_9AGAR|nr:hypothetical protein EST38_g1328 [Candolleomyces aberdarensis]
MPESEHSSPTSAYSDSDDETSPEQPAIPRYIAKYFLEETLGSGYSGSIFRAKHIHNGSVVALKVQRVDHECPTNRYERYLYPLLQGGKGMPTLYHSGVQGNWDYLAIDLLGPSLDGLFRKSGKDLMDLGSVCSIAMQVIARLETMHTRAVLHRDIQLGNCVIGLPPNDKVIYMIDFGFSKRYIDPLTNRHIPDSREKRDFIGNYWFSSVNVHCRGRVPSRRDDLEAAGLMFIHLLTPRGLTWTRNGVPKTSSAHDRLIGEKQTARPEDLCRGMPVEFEDFLRYTRKLRFEQCPDYAKWIQTFKDLAMENGYSGKEDFIWPPKPPVANAPKPFNTPLRAARPAVPREQMEGILNGLTNLNLGARPVLGDRTNVEEATKKAKDALIKSAEREKRAETEDAESVPPIGKSKAVLLADLSNKTSRAVDNAALAKYVQEFVKILQMNSSKTLTKEASRFLDVLYKQLDDPSVFIQPQKVTRTRSFGDDAFNERAPAHAKLGVVARLRFDVKNARTNKALAVLVADFAKVTNKCVGRSITKDGFIFLEGVAQRLTALH